MYCQQVQHVTMRQTLRFGQQSSQYYEPLQQHFQNSNCQFKEHNQQRISGFCNDINCELINYLMCSQCQKIHNHPLTPFQKFDRLFQNELNNENSHFELLMERFLYYKQEILNSLEKIQNQLSQDQSQMNSLAKNIKNCLINQIPDKNFKLFQYKKQLENKYIASNSRNGYLVVETYLNSTFLDITKQLNNLKGLIDQEVRTIFDIPQDSYHTFLKLDKILPDKKSINAYLRIESIEIKVGTNNFGVAGDDTGIILFKTTQGKSICQQNPKQQQNMPRNSKQERLMPSQIYYLCYSMAAIYFSLVEIATLQKFQYDFSLLIIKDQLVPFTNFDGKQYSSVKYVQKVAPELLKQEQPKQQKLDIQKGRSDLDIGMDNDIDSGLYDSYMYDDIYDEDDDSNMNDIIYNSQMLKGMKQRKEDIKDETLEDRIEQRREERKDARDKRKEEKLLEDESYKKSQGIGNLIKINLNENLVSSRGKQRTKQ